MYKLKQIPEDFIVEEVSDQNFEKEGKYLICKLEKKNYNTEDAVQTLCRALNTIRKNIGYAGTKDRNAVTTQYVSLYMGSKERVSNLELKDITLEIVGRSKSPLSLGDLKGNEFTIIIRNLETNIKIKRIKKFPNYFDKQRFSKNNIRIGKSLIKKQFSDACEIIKEDNQYGSGVKEKLEKQPHNYTEALQQVPEKILLIYVHAYQSYIWNETVEEYTKKEREQTEIPLIGFGTEIEDKELQKIIEKILTKENLTLRDFIIREFPYISLEGTSRKLYSEIENLEIGKEETDELNEGKKKISIKFFLKKGSYATMAVKHLIK